MQRRTTVSEFSTYVQYPGRPSADEVIRGAPIDVYAQEDINGPAIVWIGFSHLGTQARIQLTGAERIALVEALGGKRA